MVQCVCIFNMILVKSAESKSYIQLLISNDKNMLLSVQADGDNKDACFLCACIGYDGAGICRKNGIEYITSRTDQECDPLLFNISPQDPL